MSPLASYVLAAASALAAFLNAVREEWLLAAFFVLLMTVVLADGARRRRS